MARCRIRIADELLPNPAMTLAVEQHPALIIEPDNHAVVIERALQPDGLLTCTPL